MHDPDAFVWGGDQDIQVSQQGMKVFGVSLGWDEFATRFLEKKSEHHDVVISKIPLVPDVQACWLLLSFLRCHPSNFHLRNVEPRSCTFVRHFARHEGAPLSDVSAGALQQSTLPFHLGGLGLASAVRTRDGAYWGELG